MGTNGNKSGYAYLKERIAELESLVDRKDAIIHRLNENQRKLETVLAAVKEEKSQESFNRMVQGVRKINGWKK